MTLSEYALSGASWIGVILVQVTLITLLGLLAWLLARRCGPALRGACLLAALAGVMLTPVLALVAPVWLPLPDCLCPVSADAKRAIEFPPPPVALARTNPATLSSNELVVVVPPTPMKAPLTFDDPTNVTEETKQAKSRPAVVNLTVASEDVEGTVRLTGPVPVTPSEGSQIAGLLAALWLLGTLFCMARALVRLALLYHIARRSRPIIEPEWVGCVTALAQRLGLSAVEIRESLAVCSPLTLGLLRPVILLPIGRRDWSNAQRELILGHELAHVRRRDFLAGLVAELVQCLCWFHPLVRWLADRLRLEQEFAADASVASAVSDSTEYVRCLARLALEHGRGRSSLAPALWRRRAEILRRIDMLRHNPAGLPSRLGKRAAWTVAGLALTACLVIAGVGPLQSADSRKDDDRTQQAQGKDADPQGDPLPAGALARLGTTRLRHGADVTFVSFGADGKTLITAGQDNTIRLWDLENCKEVRRFARPKPAEPKPLKKDNQQKKKAEDALMQMMMGGGGGESGTFSVAISPDSKTLAAAASGVVQLWEVESGKELHQLDDAPAGLAGLVYSPDGKTLAGRTAVGGLFIWSAETGKQLHHIKPSKRENQDGLVFVIGGGNAAPVGLTYTPDGKSVIAAATDFNKQEEVNSIKFWDAATGKETRKFKLPNGGLASVLAITPDGKILACGMDNVVFLCEAESGKEIRQIKPSDGGIRSLAFSPDGKTLATRGRSQRVRLWETASGKELHKLSDGEAQQRSGGGAFLFIANGVAAPETRVLAMSADGKRIAAAAGSTIRLWETASGKELPLIEGHWRAPSAIVLSPDGKRAITWGGDRVVRRWDAATGKSLGSFPAPARTTLGVFSGDGQRIAFANADNTIRIHDTATGKELSNLKGHADGTTALAFSPGGKVLASRGGGNSVRLYDVVKGVELRQLGVRPAQPAPDGNLVLVFGGSRGANGTGPGLAFSPDGSLVVVPVSGNNERSNSLVLFDTNTGKELRKIESPQPIASFAFSPDGRSIAAEITNRTILVWEVASGKQRFHLGKAPDPKQQQGNGGMGLNIVVDGLDFGGFNSPGGPVGISFSPDGKVLIVRGSERTIRIWDVLAATEIGKLQGHTGRVETVVFNANGKTLASGSSDTTILIWDASKPLKALSRPTETQLSQDELGKLWDDLAGEDVAKAYRGVRGLATAPRQSVPFLSEHVKPAARIDAAKITGWITDLSSAKFAVRQEAATALLKVGEQAVPALRKELASVPELESRKRIEDILNRLTGGVLTTEQIRTVRAVEALELIGTPEARKFLETLAAGAPGTLPTREAEAALIRLQQTR
jgi:WD40 repeat protein/beta-lactamase regulating signal transducer with metallopeptidase domain